MTSETIKKIGIYRIRRPLSGGKAGKNGNITSNVQIINIQSMCLEKQFSFKMNDTNSFLKARQKAFDYCSKNTK